MLTKQQKTEKIEETQKLLDNSRSLVFVDFTDTSVTEITSLRKSLKAIGAAMKVVKKRLLRIALKGKGVELDTKEQFQSQLGTIFSPNEVFEPAGVVYKFLKNLKKGKNFQIVGGYDLSEKIFFNAETIKKFGQLPSREALLGQLVVMLTMPIRMMMCVLQERSKKVGN